MRIFAVLSVLFVSIAAAMLLFESYAAASIGDLDSFVDATAASSPDCRSPSVVAAVERSWDKTKSGRFTAQLLLARAFHTREEEKVGFANWALNTFQRSHWLSVTRDADTIAAAICANGVAGHDYNLAGVGAFVGIRDIARADPRALQALSDVYVLDLRGAVAGYLRLLHQGHLSQSSLRALRPLQRLLRV